MNLVQNLQFLHDIVLGYSRKNEGDKVKGVLNHEGGKTKGHEHAYKVECFQMPLHYPRYKRDDYAGMEEWKLDNLLQQYGMAFDGGLEEKRAFAMGAFLWPNQR